jgi:hypothetical protein
MVVILIGYVIEEFLPREIIGVEVSAEWFSFVSDERLIMVQVVPRAKIYVQKALEVSCVVALRVREMVPDRFSRRRTLFPVDFVDPRSTFNKLPKCFPITRS